MVAPTPIQPPQISNPGIDLQTPEDHQRPWRSKGPWRGRAHPQPHPVRPLPPAQGAGDPASIWSCFFERAAPGADGGRPASAGPGPSGAAALAQTERQLLALHSGRRAGCTWRWIATAASGGCCAVAGLSSPVARVDLEVESVPGFDAISALLGGQLDLLLTSDVQARGDLHFDPVRLRSRTGDGAGSPSASRVASRRTTCAPRCCWSTGGAGPHVDDVQPLPATRWSWSPPAASRWTTPPSCCRWLPLASGRRPAPLGQRGVCPPGLSRPGPWAAGSAAMYGAVRAADRDRPAYRACSNAFAPGMAAQ